ncbi:lysophospholipid acyltransferase family protein [Fontimonas sp. SYSU GA230001]|uniref:lysophospholipid acyltransferase family protein n=1 Tax=Fontimonas sp. SYSU GA230001 TaxID=3142450 RepID=UPI0032B59466
MRSTLRVWIRATRLSVHVVTGLLLAVAVNLSFGRLRPEPLARWWSLRLQRVIQLRVKVRGRAHSGARVTVANHVSWLDIPLIAACEPARFIAKSEIRDWPIAGWLANAAGTFYIRRGKGGARPLIEQLVPHLVDGGSVVLFPEGTTTDGCDVLPFHARLFGAAIDAGAPVQPVALRYGPGRGGRAVAPFIGDDDLLSHILRLLREPEIVAEIVYGEPIATQGLERDALARHAETAVRTALALPQRHIAQNTIAPTALAA